MSLPWIVNVAPPKESKDVPVLRPIQFSIRDGDTYINPTNLRVAAGYAKVFSNATQFFDKELPATSRVHLTDVTGTEPTLAIVTDGVFVQRLLGGGTSQRSVYVTSIEAGPGFRSVALTAILKPGASNAEGSNGALIAIENGPRNKIAYLWFQKVSGDPILRFTSSITSPVINQTVSLDWTALRRYTILWNEVDGYVEVYTDNGANDNRIFRVAISSIPEMSDTYVKFGGPDELVALYGVHPNAFNDSVTIKNIAFTSDVAYPVLGSSRPGDFLTQIISTELIKSTGDQDLRNDDISSWLPPPSNRYPDEDEDAVAGNSAKLFRMSKLTVDKTFVLYREEPGLLTSDDDGFMVQARLHASPSKTEGSSTGMGLTVCDGQNLFQIQLFKDPGFNTIGILMKDGTETDITEHFTPDTKFDWKNGRLFRFVVDPRREVMELYDGEDLVSPILSVPFVRADLPSVGDMGWSDVTPFIAVGHIHAVDTKGDFYLHEVSINHLYHSWQANDPVASPASADPPFTLSQVSATNVEDNDEWKITTPYGGLSKYSRTAFFGFRRGVILEARLKIDSWRPKTRTGVYLIIDDGIRIFAVTFVDTYTGKYVALSQRSGLGTFQEIVGRDGAAAEVSFMLDWTQPHTYRLERSAYYGFQVFVDDELEPRLTFPETKLSQLPNPMYGGTPTIGFGHYTSEGAVSRWKFVRGLFSRGYDISFKKNKPDHVLRDELFKTQAIVIAHAQDNDA